MLNREMTVARIVLDHPETARIFQDRRIDFCCHGDVSVEDACADKGLDPAGVLAEAERAVTDRSGGEAPDFEAMSTAALVAWIIDRHHRFLRETLPWVGVLAEKVARVHGEHDARLFELKEAVDGLTEAIVPHLDEEEQVLFPALMSGRTDAGTQAALVRMYEEHESVGRVLAVIRDLSDDFTLPEWACRSYRTLFAELEALETDTLRHVHLENHVLRPRFAR